MANGVTSKHLESHLWEAANIDEIVKKVRFPDWQRTSQGERLVQKELRKALLKYKLHTDQELFDKAYGYIRQYY
ncbi:MAG: hypothetical protein NT140_02265 [Deltaproteobacteria bacterium]|nr:hypothetical protein [Deltaproteobacteria bacterium]